MSFFVNTAFRSEENEIMDDFTLEGEMFRDTLDKLETINRLLGGNVVTINGVKKLLKDQPKDQPITIIDLGCGHGDILRDVAKFGRKNGYNMKLLGIDANPTAIEYADELSTEFHELSFTTEDIFSMEFKKRKFDVVLATLFLHHFKEEELVSFLGNTLKQTKKHKSIISQPEPERYLFAVGSRAGYPVDSLQKVEELEK